MTKKLRVVWITGAGKGIGRALAKRMALDGWIVAASARTETDLLSLVEECPGGNVHAFPLDVTDASASEGVLAQIEAELGTPDMAVFNAGTHIPVSADTFSADVFRKMVDTNLMGTVNGLAYVLPRFIKRKSGHIAVVASVAGYRGLPTSAAYGATKAALINMCEALKPELDRHNVRISVINPGFVETPLTDKNKFPMPFLITAGEAAECIVRGINGSAFEIAFPGRFAFLMKVLRILPDRLFFAVARRMVRP
jgi:NAD(P)-dependent dehydrogenase (short-subunit alcohol dehydrogenase family)